MSTRVISRSFNGGEISLEMFGRFDDQKFQSGAEVMRNMISTPSGPAQMRPGTEFIAEAKDVCRLIEFEFSTDDAFIVEMGAGYFRFHKKDGTVQVGSPAAWSNSTAYEIGDLVSLAGNDYYCIADHTNQSPPNSTFWFLIPSSAYEIPNPYLEEDLFEINFVQSNDIITLVHEDYPPAELKRIGPTTWVYGEIDFDQTLPAPFNVNIPTSGDSTPPLVNTYKYVVTSVDADGNESRQSLPTSGTLYNFNASNVYLDVAWSAANDPRVVAYNVYRSVNNGIYGFIGQVTSKTFRDPGITESISESPPVLKNPFKSKAIVSVPVTNGGSGYGSITSDGSILSVQVVDGGSNYINPQITVTDSSGTGATLTPSLSSYTGEIIAATIISGGSGYTASPTVTVSDPTGTGATLTAIATGGVITSVTITNGGSGYTNPTLYFNGVTFVTAASIVLTVDGGSINSITVTNGGTNYTSPNFNIVDSQGSGALLLANSISPSFASTPQLTVTDSTGFGAVLQAVITSGVITAINVIDGGQDYTAPVVSISWAAGGSGATFGAPVLNNPAGSFPSAVTYFEQRKVFGGGINDPQRIVMTRTGTETNFTVSKPLQDNDAVFFKIAARSLNKIRHLVPSTSLIALSNSTEWRVTSVNTDAITPTSLQVRAQSFVGADYAQPVTVNNNVIFASARGGKIREMGFNQESGGLSTTDMTLRAAHLFEDAFVKDMSFSSSPYPMVWVVLDDGTLRSMTYVPDQKVWAWNRHDTYNGEFESVAAIIEDRKDTPYFVIKRNIDGTEKRFIERMVVDGAKERDPQDAWCLDCALLYEGSPASTFSNLDHLEGETVSILADGMVFPPQEVVSGSVSIDGYEAEKVVIGLPYVADLKTLPIYAEAPGGAQGRAKNVTNVWLRLYRSSAIFVGPDENSLVEYKQRTNEPLGSPPRLINDEIHLTISPSWFNRGGAVLIRQAAPLPLTIVNITMEVEFGGR